MAEDDNEEARFEGEWYRWGCPACEDVNETEIDPRSDTVACPCGWEGRCGG